MVERPVFCPEKDGAALVREVPINFRWHPGFSATQKKKSVAELHEAAHNAGISPVLEVSTKSSSEVGRRLSAFSLKMRVGEIETSLESAFQASKVFENGGPYIDLLNGEARDAKRDPRLKSSGRLVAFELNGRRFPTKPTTAFYDWLYVRILYDHKKWLERLQDFAGFTDIEFNPERSLNCQARSLATYVSLDLRNKLDSAMTSFETFAGMLETSNQEACLLNPSRPVKAERKSSNKGVENELRIDLERELCRAYVHIARRSEYKHLAFNDDQVIARQALHALVNVEDEGLISALGRLRRLIDASKKHGILSADLGHDLYNLDMAIKEIRDMREHYDQYLVGLGRKQGDFVKTFAFIDGSTMSANAKWSLQKGSEEVLGARLRVDDVAKALNRLREELETDGKWVLPHKATDLANLAVGPLKNDTSKCDNPQSE